MASMLQPGASCAGDLLLLLELCLPRPPTPPSTSSCLSRDSPVEAAL